MLCKNEPFHKDNEMMSTDFYVAFNLNQYTKSFF